MDEFYNILRKRAAEALLAKGIDPINDRGATYLRTSYYILVLCLWIASGYFHVMVRLDLYPDFRGNIVLLFEVWNKPRYANNPISPYPKLVDAWTWLIIIDIALYIYRVVYLAHFGLQFLDG